MDRFVLLPCRCAELLCGGLSSVSVCLTARCRHFCDFAKMTVGLDGYAISHSIYVLAGNITDTGGYSQTTG